MLREKKCKVHVGININISMVIIDGERYNWIKIEVQNERVS